MDLGINLAPPSYYWGMAVTIDRALIGSKITVQAKSTGAIAADGWPVGAGNYLQGTILDATPQEYTLIVLTGAISKVDVNQGADNGGHVKVVPDSHGIATFTAKGGVSLGITTTDPGKTSWAIVPSNQIDLWHANPKALNPAYVSRYPGFRTVRFMDWMRTNTNLTPGYPDPDMTAGSPLLGPVHLDMIVALTLATRCEPMINIPVNAIDDEVRRIITAFKPVFAAGLKVWIEFGNEVWNDQFKAKAAAIAQENILWGKAEQAAYKAAVAAKQKATKPPTATGQRWYGYRATQVSKIIQATGLRVRDHFHMVVGTFTNLPQWADYVWSGVALAGGTDADFSKWAITAYIHGDVGADFDKTVAMVKRWKADGNLDDAFASILHGDKSSPDWAARAIVPLHMAIATAHKLDVVVYEGNTSFYTVPTFSDAKEEMKDSGLTEVDVTAFFGAIVNDPRYAGVTEANFAVYAAAGVEVFNVFNDDAKPGEDGLWGTMRTPAWPVIQKWIAANRLDPYPALLARVVDMQRQLAALAGDVAAAAVG